MKRPAAFAPVAAAMMLLAAAPAMAQRQTSAESIEVIERTATVQTVDAETRQVLLRDDESGESFVIVAGPEVRNFAQIDPGDVVVATYTHGVSARIALAGESGSGAGAAVVTAAEGQTPGAAAGVVETAIITLDGYDRTQHLARFRGEDGVTHILRVEDQAMRDFASGLRPGTRVEVTFSEAIAIGLRERQ